MQAIEGTPTLLAAMRRLQAVLDRETAALKVMRMQELADLQDEKALLADAYAVEIGRLRGGPSQLSELDPLLRGALAAAAGELRASVATNTRALGAARQVVEGIVRSLGDSLRGTRTAASYAPAATSEAKALPAVPVAFDRAF